MDDRSKPLAVRPSVNRNPFLVHESTARRELCINRRGSITFRSSGMRTQCKVEHFRITQVHSEHVQIVVEDEEARWSQWAQSSEGQLEHQQLQGAVQDAQASLGHLQKMHEQNPCAPSMNKQRAAARKLRTARHALHQCETPDHHHDVRYDSIFAFTFALDNGISITY